MLLKLTSGNISEKFFKVFYDKMKDAQQEIKSSVTVNTVELTNRPGDEKENVGKEIGKDGRRIKSNLFSLSIVIIYIF